MVFDARWRKNPLLAIILQVKNHEIINKSEFLRHLATEMGDKQRKNVQKRVGQGSYYCNIDASL